MTKPIEPLPPPMIVIDETWKGPIPEGVLCYMPGEIPPGSLRSNIVQFVSFPPVGLTKRQKRSILKLPR